MESRSPPTPRGGERTEVTPKEENERELPFDNTANVRAAKPLWGLGAERLDCAPRPPKGENERKLLYERTAMLEQQSPLWGLGAERLD